MLGDEHVDTARSVYELADLLSRMGDYAGAEPLFREALALRRKLTGKKSPEVAQSMEGLALNLFDRAIRGFRQADAGGGRDAARTARRAASRPRRCARTISGGCSVRWASTRKPSSCTGEALEMKKVLLGDAHPAIAIGLNNVAFVAAGTGQVRGRRSPVPRRDHACSASSSGVDHPDVALALNNLAFLAHDKGDLTTAEKMSRDSLEMFRRTLGQRASAGGAGDAEPGHVAVRGRRFASAEPLVRGGTRNAQEAPGAGAFRCCGQHDAAGGSAGRDRPLRGSARAGHGAPRPSGSRRCAPDHWRTASAEAAEGAALAGLRQFEKAEQLLLASHEVLQKDKAAVHIYLTNSSRWLAKLYQAMGQPEKAAQYRVSQESMTCQSRAQPRYR